ncbi:MAG TPA: glycosyltransferase family 2 protein [Candidatus Didemnitutus sp.]|nr:glycosyltransferase family 2 protein [Candidatus Didemnitutus sp.]
MNKTPSLSVWPGFAAHDGAGLPPAGDWPKISIVTPNYNYGHLIETTVRSVLEQEYPNLEYIVIDDGSTDNSVEVVAPYVPKLAHYEHQANQGQYPTINKGFARATGEICAWLNSDDIYLPWTLKTVATIFTQFPEVDWIAGRFSAMQDCVVHEIRPFTPFPRRMIRAGMFFEPAHGGYGHIQQESCFWRRSLWEKAGGLRTELRFAADFELWTRFAQHADLYAVHTLLGGFTHRLGQNRSLANSDRYVSDIQAAIAELRRDPSSAEARLARRLMWYQRFNRRFGRGLASRLVSVADLTGPTIEWDFDQGRYFTHVRKMF